MLRLMLDSHPQLAVPFESGFIVDYYRRLDAYGDLSVRANAARILRDISHSPLVRKGYLLPRPEVILDRSVRTYSELVAAIFESYASAEGKEHWGDKTPSYVTDIEVLRAIFPECKIIHVVRDGRDVALSNRNIKWGIHSLPRVAADWRWKVTLGHKLGCMLGSDYQLIRYEDLVLEPESTLRLLTCFLGVSYSDAMLAYHKRCENKIPVDSLLWHRNSVRAPDSSLVAQWRCKMSRTDRIIFEQYAADALAMFGYELERSLSTIRSRLKSLYFATLKRY